MIEQVSLYLNGNYFKNIEIENTFLDDLKQNKAIYLFSHKVFYKSNINDKIWETGNVIFNCKYIIETLKFIGILNNKDYVISNAKNENCIIKKESGILYKYLFPEEIISKNIKKISKYDLLDLEE